MTDDLVAFLRARLDEDEQTAREAGNRRWLVQDNIIELHPEREDDGFMSWPTRSDAQHAARHDPARVLREVEAKRRVVERHADCGSGGGYCDDGGHGWDHLPSGGCAELADLAAVYAGHPDYREEWRPN